MVAVWEIWDELETVENKLMAMMMALTVVGAVALPFAVAQEGEKMPEIKPVRSEIIEKNRKKAVVHEFETFEDCEAFWLRNYLHEPHMKTKVIGKNIIAWSVVNGLNKA